MQCCRFCGACVFGTMKIRLTNFRTFRSTEFLPVRTLNVLVGENSSGKSSYMAATKFIFDIFANESVASFNSDPFFLGSFRDIAHFRGGRAGGAKTFSLAVSIDIEGSVARLRRRNPVPPELLGAGAPDYLEMELEFGVLKAQAILQSLYLSAGDIRLTMAFRRSEIEISDDTGASLIVSFPIRSTSTSNYMYDLFYLNYILSNARTLKSVSAGVEHTPGTALHRKIDLLGSLVETALQQFRVVTVATAPVRTEPQRVYQISEKDSQKIGNQAAYNMAQMSAFEATEWTALKKSIEGFGQSAGLFRQIAIRHLSKTKDGPFQIELKIGNRSSNIIDVGYGVSQALPLIFDLLRAKRPSVFFIQQPEVHLHPQAQVELATAMLDIAKRGRHKVFLETHSDFILDRIRSDIRDKPQYNPSDVGILFFKRNLLESHIDLIEMNKNGELKDVPIEYRSFFLNEKKRSMGLA